MTLELRHITKAFPARNRCRRRVLEDLHLTVSPGDSIGITGPSGIGKTTLGLILAGILPPDTGKMMVNEVDFWSAPRRERRAMGRRLQMVFQHPESSFNPRWTIRQSLSEPYRLRGLRPDDGDLKVRLEAVGLTPAVLSRRPHQLSGGELQRVAIARIMILDPEVIVLDEPTAMLDVITQSGIMDLLDRFRRENGTGVVLISHEPGLVRGFCRKIFRLENGRLGP